MRSKGKELPAGKYAFYAIPTSSQWTLVFSKFTSDWGGYNYDAAEDALRVNVTPQPAAESQERLAYTFDDVTNNSAIASLRWEKLRIPMKIEVDLPSTVRESISSELRDRAKAVATEPETIALAYQPLVSAKKYDEAAAWLNNYATAHPASADLWRVFDALGGVYAAKGDKVKARQYYDQAMNATHDNAERTEVWDSINAMSAGGQ